ncbi:unnamed protein product [Cuscuta epithymum]|uniref:Uncharacterized protein n=1 Tax=Cuscuta epithymum TaxID=186058 RepID=A0AAV0C8Q8_9ASTE|nr:unnamed protein product [Cuscuta epithymum]
MYLRILRFESNLQGQIFQLKAIFSAPMTAAAGGTGDGGGRWRR